ncbi:MAG: pilus assembly protein PilX [Oscillospiraceae bacterium]|nr:pilus assembly protein PilX [Oscillospiraceae bacterium]
MRKWNAVVSGGIMLLLLVHMVAGALQTAGLLGGGQKWLKVVAWVMLALVLVHMIIGIKLTIDTLRTVRESGVSYTKENRLFWLRRISGFAVMAFVVCHVVIFLGKTQNGVFRLHLFAGAELATQLLLVVSIAVHVLSNISPLLIGLGAKRLQKLLPDLLLILALLLLAAGIGFVLYFIRWNTL